MSNVIKGRFGARTPTRDEVAVAPAARDASGAPASDTVTVYGLESCSTCDKARQWLARENVPHAFVDYRKHPIDGVLLKSWAKLLGWEKLVNRASLTWRGLPPERKTPQGDAEWLLLVRDHPSLIRRPVVLRSGVDANGAPLVTVGFTDKLFKSLFAP